MVEVSNVGVDAETEVGSCDSKNMSVERPLFVVRTMKGNKSLRRNEKKPKPAF